MSRYDYRDPGTDPAYCDGLQATDDPEADAILYVSEAAGALETLGLVETLDGLTEAYLVGESPDLTPWAHTVLEYATTYGWDEALRGIATAFREQTAHLRDLERRR